MLRAAMVAGKTHCAIRSPLGRCGSIRVLLKGYVCQWAQSYASFASRANRGIGMESFRRGQKGFKQWPQYVALDVGESTDLDVENACLAFLNQAGDVCCFQGCIADFLLRQGFFVHVKSWD